MPSVLVTGGAGFIGSHVVDVLVERGWRVRVLDLLHPAAHDGPPPYASAGAEYLWGDLAHGDLALRAADGMDAVSHQASMVGLGKDLSDVADYVRHNDLATAKLLWALDRTGFAGRLVLASSMVVYGEGRYRCPAHGSVRPGPRLAGELAAGDFEVRCPDCRGPLEPQAIPEDAPADPRSIYAATKLHQEHLCAVYGDASGVPVASLRYHNVYGPRMPRDTPYAGVASIFRSALEAGRPAEVYEDGGQIRDFVHVRDVARANVLALEGEPATGPFNICSGRPVSIGRMAQTLTDAFGPHAPAPRVTEAWRAGDVRHVFASPERAERELGFRAEIGFEDGMREFARAQLR
jgi:dTDP-L-rhamnose 4-epimerase